MLNCLSLAVSVAVENAEVVSEIESDAIASQSNIMEESRSVIMSLRSILALTRNVSRQRLHREILFRKKMRDVMKGKFESSLAAERQRAQSNLEKVKGKHRLEVPLCIAYSVEKRETAIYS